MIPQRVAATTARRLSYLLQTNCRISKALGQPRIPWSHKNPRFLSTTGGGGNDDDDNSNNNNNSDDPFGVQFDDGADKVGPIQNLPPKYRRDATTGKFTGDVEAELTPEEREILNMDPLERDKHLLKRLVQSWENENEKDDDPNNGDPKALTDFARRVRLAKMSLNVLGRTVQAQAATSILEDGDEFGREPETGFTQALTKSEFETFQKYMRDQHGKEITEEDVPVHPDDKAATRKTRRQRPSPLEDEDIAIQGITDDASVDADNPDLSLKWLTSRAHWEVNKKYGEEGPFDEMMPRDLTMTRIVNRKRAKVLPRELLHHNNLALLRRYVSPAGQIMHRVRTRLGARDQRKIARLVKRARNLGLIPHTGQFVVEDHGNIHEKDLAKNRPWEEELIRRGLVISKKQQKQEEEDNGGF